MAAKDRRTTTVPEASEQLELERILDCAESRMLDSRESALDTVTLAVSSNTANAPLHGIRKFVGAGSPTFPWKMAGIYNLP